MIDESNWRELRATFNGAFRSSLHFSIATLGQDGEPHVTPIGSILLAGPGHALYFEVFAKGLGDRLHRDPRLSILAVDSAKLLWLHGLVRGRFRRRPGVRLYGRADTESRPSTELERRRWRKRVGPAWALPGSGLLWSQLGVVRDIRVERIEALRMGPLDG